jgi:DNA-binding MarR family transcriptional regulator
MKKMPLLPVSLFTSATKFALVQSKFHRISKQHMTEALKPLKLSTVEWIILGYLSHVGREVSFSAVAREVGVKDSFISVVASKLETRALIAVVLNGADKRMKGMKITREGKKILALAERQFVHFFAPLVSGLTEKDLIHFLHIVKTINVNYSARYPSTVK